jgi:hypothetical protein
MHVQNQRNYQQQQAQGLATVLQELSIAQQETGDDYAMMLNRVGKIAADPRVKSNPTALAAIVPLQRHVAEKVLANAQETKAAVALHSAEKYLAAGVPFEELPQEILANLKESHFQHLVKRYTPQFTKMGEDVVLEMPKNLGEDPRVAFKRPRTETIGGLAYDVDPVTNERTPANLPMKLGQGEALVNPQRDAQGNVTGMTVGAQLPKAIELSEAVKTGLARTPSLGINEQQLSAMLASQDQEVRAAGINIQAQMDEKGRGILKQPGPPAAPGLTGAEVQTLTRAGVILGDRTSAAQLSAPEVAILEKKKREDEQRGVQLAGQKSAAETAGNLNTQRAIEGGDLEVSGKINFFEKKFPHKEVHLTKAQARDPKYLAEKGLAPVTDDQEARLVRLAKTAFPAIQRLREILPQLHAVAPGKNLTQALKIAAQRGLGVSELIGQLDALKITLAAESGRLQTGSVRVPVTMFEKVLHNELPLDRQTLGATLAVTAVMENSMKNRINATLGVELDPYPKTSGERVRTSVGDAVIPPGLLPPRK